MASTKMPLGASSAHNVAEVAHTMKPKDRSASVKPKDDTSGLMRLQQEVDGLRGRVARRDETIAKLKAGSAGAVDVKHLETQVQDLVKRHEAAKEKHRLDIESLTKQNAALQAGDKHRERESQLTAKLADLRAKLALSDAEARRMKDELAARPLPQKGPMIDERLAWKKEKAALDAELRQANKEADKWMGKCRQLESTSQDLSAMRTENERLRYGWSVMAEQYGQLYETLQTRARSHAAERSAASGAQQRTEAQLSQAIWHNDQITQQNVDLQEQVRHMQDEVALLSQTLHEAVTHRASDRTPTPTMSDPTLPDLAPTIDALETQSALELAIGHAELGQSEISDRAEHISLLTSKIIDLEQALHSAEAALTTAQNHSRLLRDEQEALKEEHASCAPTISQLRVDIDQADRVIERRGQEVQEVRLELHRANQKTDRQADMIKSASEEVSRAKYAQDVLEEEVHNLREKYIEAAGFEDKYQDLLEQQTLLETREAIAIEQAERVAMENAELMGHPDGSSRIGYVDGVRREMALCRQELASTRHHLNAANDRIASLENEISAYKTISPESAMGASRTRVVRRQPEGGRLTTSTSVSGPRRAVSGPGGAMRFV